MRTLAALMLAFALAGCAGGQAYLPLGQYHQLNDELLARVEKGQSQEQVREMLGPPVQTMNFPRLGHVAWDYRYVDTWGYQAIFSVTFDADGRVVSKISQRLERRGRD